MSCLPRSLISKPPDGNSKSLLTVYLIAPDSRQICVLSAATWAVNVAFCCWSCLYCAWSWSYVPCETHAARRTGDRNGSNKPLRLIACVIARWFPLLVG